MALPNEKFEEIKSKIQKFVDKEMVPHEQEFSVNHKFADLSRSKTYNSAPNFLRT